MLLQCMYLDLKTKHKVCATLNSCRVSLHPCGSLATRNLPVSKVLGYLTQSDQNNLQIIQFLTTDPEVVSDSEVTVRQLGRIMQKIFLLNQEPAFANGFGNGLERLVSKGLFPLFLKTFVATISAQFTSFCPN